MQPSWYCQLPHDAHGARMSCSSPCSRRAFRAFSCVATTHVLHRADQLFMHDMRDRLADVAPTERMSKLAAMWQNLSEEQRKPYVARALEAQVCRWLMQPHLVTVVIARRLQFDTERDDRHPAAVLSLLRLLQATYELDAGDIPGGAGCVPRLCRLETRQAQAAPGTGPQRCSFFRRRSHGGQARTPRLG